VERGAIWSEMRMDVHFIEEPIAHYVDKLCFILLLWQFSERVMERSALTEALFQCKQDHARGIRVDLSSEVLSPSQVVSI
jgi:hypothetical protein